ncbi:MAG TPA: hypothetical protein VFB08_14650 [Burkholderiales bacterium]|nr:hypothetical protein [Burkholderiales bacterium]
MKICVGRGRSLGGQDEPGAFYLGGRRLPVQSVLERWSDAQYAYFKVRVEDGRRFTLRYDSAAGCWELVCVTRPAPLERQAALRW